MVGPDSDIQDEESNVCNFEDHPCSSLSEKIDNDNEMVQRIFSVGIQYGR